MLFSFDKKPYIAVIGDIVDSKKIENRKEVQRKLKEILEEINIEFASSIYSRFMITLGDEFQGLLASGKDLIKIVKRLEFKMYPTNIRFGVGIGDIVTDIDRDVPLGADGPAYYSARRMINEIKQNEKKRMKGQTNIMITIDNIEYLEELINSNLELCTVIKKNWTKRQREIIIDYWQHEDGQSNAAKRLGVTQSTIQRGLSLGNYYTYKHAMDVLSNILGQIGERANA